LPRSVAQSGAGSSVGAKVVDAETDAADAEEAMISPGTASSADTIATVAMPDGFVQRIHHSSQ
jgi:hypothetical protein